MSTGGHLQAHDSTTNFNCRFADTTHMHEVLLRFGASFCWTELDGQVPISMLGVSEQIVLVT